MLMLLISSCVLALPSWSTNTITDSSSRLGAGLEAGLERRAGGQGQLAHHCELLTLSKLTPRRCGGRRMRVELRVARSLKRLNSWVMREEASSMAEAEAEAGERYR